MEKIQELSPEVIDQIAAGEVVERPAHLVKELVENSLDAGASKIQIEFSMGGQKVKVTDNGIGIDKSELKLAFSRHATSKIRKSEDLWTLNSFGFRGEALASLSAVSKIKMISRTSNSPSAFSLTGIFGKFGEIESIGGQEGTSIWIEELFGNLPARKKFLKSDAAEATQLKNVLKALALHHYKVEFRIVYKNDLLYFWPAMESALERVKQILEIDEIYEGEGHCENYSAKVFVGAPHCTVKTRKQIWLFAQGRWIQDNSIQAAVMDAYRGLLMHGEYPYTVVFLNVPTDCIDVNVHPAKSQVKFSEPSNTFRAVHRAVRGVLEQAPWLDKILKKQEKIPEQKNISTYSSPNYNSSKTKELITNMSFESQEFNHTQWQQKDYKLDIEDKNTTQAPARIVVEEVKTTKLRENIDNKNYWSSLQVLSQAALTYIICQSKESLIIVDQHAAHERVVYESLIESWLEGSLEIQSLLIPLIVRMDAEKLEAILNIKHELKKLGFDIEATGPESLAINNHPIILKEFAIEKALQFLGQELVDKGGSFALEKALRELAATMACHSVVRAGQALSTEEMKALLVSMDEYPLSSFCPHGRPVFVEIPFTKLEKDFGRIV
ncbi:MAG: DNA mismatch repair endonuclease MutL [Bdellovibrionaceae bacterium]|nr:DNA mismatch repair endonuclease MutL [Pseudobdellovibrionaceae bacterium]